MMQKLYLKIYPFLSISALEITKHVELIQAFGDIFTLIVQTIIGGLTIWKLSKEIKEKFFNKSNN